MYDHPIEMQLTRILAEQDARFQAVAHEAVHKHSVAHVCEQLAAMISDFDAQLDQAHEVGMRLVSFGGEVVFHVEALDPGEPNLIIFEGTTRDGSRVQLIQHVSQLSFLLTALPRAKPNEPKTPFGFRTDHLASLTSD